MLIHAKALYIAGKLCFFENAYVKSLRDFEACIEMLQNSLAQMEEGDRDRAHARMAKAYMNMALTKSMSSNHKQAIVICDKAWPIIDKLATVASPEETKTSSTREKKHTKILFKCWYKKATLQKRAGSFSQSYRTLSSLIGLINNRLSKSRR